MARQRKARKTSSLKRREFRISAGKEFVERGLGEYSLAEKGKIVLSPQGRNLLRRKLGISDRQIMHEERRLAVYPGETIRIPGRKGYLRYVAAHYAPILSILRAYFRGLRGKYPLLRSSQSASIPRKRGKNRLRRFNDN